MTNDSVLSRAPGFPCAHTPLRRLAEPEDIAGAVLAFCADGSRHVTGTYLPVCGGAHML